MASQGIRPARGSGRMSRPPRRGGRRIGASSSACTSRVSGFFLTGTRGGHLVPGRPVGSVVPRAEHIARLRLPSLGVPGRRVHVLPAPGERHNQRARGRRMQPRIHGSMDSPPSDGDLFFYRRGCYDWDL